MGFLLQFVKGHLCPLLSRRPKKAPLVRQLIMGVNLRPRSPDAYADLLRALSAIGNNINQLAHQANARGAATGDEITEALHLVRQATRLVRERL